jgi:cyclic-di-GMP-binding protein
VDPRAMDFGKSHYASGNMVRKDIQIKEGLEKEIAKKIVKAIKDSGLKVQAQIMDDQVRVTGKKIDDLQEIMALCRNTDFGVPLQFENLK